MTKTHASASITNRHLDHLMLSVGEKKGGLMKGFGEEKYPVVKEFEGSNARWLCFPFHIFLIESAISSFSYVSDSAFKIILSATF